MHRPLVLLLAGSCAANSDPSAFDVDVTLSEHIATVATVRWTTELGTPTAAEVRFGRDGATEYVAPVDLTAGPPWETVLLGMKPDTTYDVQVVAQVAGEARSSASHPVTTGPSPSSLPASTLTVGTASELAAGHMFLLTSFLIVPAVVILDADGDPVWWHVEPSQGFPISRARLSRDRSHITYWSANVYQDDAQELVSVPITGGEPERWSRPRGHHDFLVLPDGTFAMIEYAPRDGTMFRGDRIVEWSPGQEAIVVFDTWDHLEFIPSLSDPGTIEDWTHANYLQYDPDADAYTLSCRHLESQIRVDRATGEIQWILGGADSDFTLDGSTDIYSAPHGFEVHGDTVLTFNNGLPQETHTSEVLELRLDHEAGVAEEIWRYRPPNQMSFSLGNVTRLDGGNTVAVFSNLGVIEEVDPEGEVQWRLATDLGGAFGYAEVLESLHAQP